MVGVEGPALGWPLSPSGLLSLAVLLPLALLPGATASFGLPCRGLSRLDRALLGAVLTPFFVAAALMLLKAVGLPFGSAARVVMASCSVGLVLTVWRLRTEPRQPGDRGALAAVGVVACIFAGVLWWSWFSRGETHFSSLHAMHHAELVYAVTKPGAIPENPMLAGVPLRYPFLGHYYWAWLGWCLDVNPLVLWERTALVWFGVTALTYYRAGLALGLRPWFAVLGVVILLAGNSPFELVRSLFADPLGPGGPVRYGAYLQKFSAFNLMLFALPGLAGVLLLSLHVLRGAADRSWLVLLALVTLAAGAVYPILFPFSLALAGLPLVLPGISLRTRRDVLAVLGLTGAAFAAIMLFFIGSRGRVPLDAWQLGFAASKLGEMALALGPFLLIALPELNAGLRRLDPRTLLLAAIVALGAGFYVVVPLPSLNEYKAVYVAMLGAGLLAARSLDLRIGLRDVQVIAAVALLTPLVAALDLARFDRLFAGHPKAREPAESERRASVSPWRLDSFWLEPRAGSPEAGWTTAIRERTRPDTVVVSPPGPDPVSSLTRRSEYVTRWRRGAGRVGFGYRARVWTVDVRGSPLATFRGRAQIQNTVYARSDQPARFRAAAAALVALGRPVAVYFPSADAPFPRFLEREQVGREIWSDATSSIRQLDPADES